MSEHLQRVELTRGEAARIVTEGRAAREAGKRLPSCPYSAASADPTERVRAAAWVRGFVLRTEAPPG